MPADFTPNGFQVDREMAREMVQAITYSPPLDQTAALLRQREEKKRAKAKARLLASDSASDAPSAASSRFFGTLGLLRSKLSCRKDHGSQQQHLPSQVSIHA